MRARWWIIVGLSLGCSRPAGTDADDDVGDEEMDGTGESTSDSTDESTSDDADGSTTTDSTTTDSTSDTTESTADTDPSDSTDSGECPPEFIECPDGFCVYTFPDFGCCSHGGECAPGCEPQDADKGMGICPGPPEYAWTGEACEEVCPCQGSDCADVFSSPIACLEAHDIGCVGGLDFSQCPFDEPVAAISITGTVLGESIDLQTGAFGIFYGKGGGDQLLLRFAADELTLANHIAHPWTDPYLESVLQTWVEPNVGVHEVTLNWGPGFDAMIIGTLTITDLDVENPDSLGYFVTGTLEVDMNGWDLAGSFGLRHCYPLNQYAP